jgi:hypothetical protein
MPPSRTIHSIVTTDTGEVTEHSPSGPSSSKLVESEIKISKNQATSPWLPVIAAVIAGSFALLGATIGSYTAATLSVRNQRLLAAVEKREQAYAQLMGHRVLLTQLYISASDPNRLRVSSQTNRVGARASDIATSSGNPTTREQERGLSGRNGSCESRAVSDGWPRAHDVSANA